MENKLSIIMPCYNCAKTLEQAVESIFQQDNLTIPFEVVMVDDASTDDTFAVIKKLQNKHFEIKSFQHERNLGGAVARNTAVKNCSGEIIFCLDGDDFCGQGSIQKMFDFLNENNLDGVMFEERRFFIGTDENNCRSFFNKNLVDGQIFFDDLFLSEGYIIGNFMYTKNAWLKCGGYPEGNDFDTQGFEFRFLACGNKIKTCPGTLYHHRQFDKNKSYFERAYEKGDFSRNFYLILEECLHIFSPKIRKEILSFNIFKHNKISDEIYFYCQQLYKNNKESFFIENWKDYLVENSLDVYCQKVNNSNDFTDIAVLAINDYKKNNFIDSINKWTRITNNLQIKTVVTYNMIKCSLMLIGETSKIDLDRHYQTIINDYLPNKIDIRLNFLAKVKNKFNAKKMQLNKKYFSSYN